MSIEKKYIKIFKIKMPTCGDNEVIIHSRTEQMFNKLKICNTLVPFDKIDVIPDRHDVIKA